MRQRSGCWREIHFGVALYYERVVDVINVLIKFTLLKRDRSGYLTDRYSKRREAAEKLIARVKLTAL